MIDSPGSDQQRVAAAVVEIMESVLRRTIADDHNFFEVGGESLKGALVVTRLRQRLGVKVTLGDLFEHPTVGQFVSFLVSAPKTAPVTGGRSRAKGKLSVMQENRFLRVTRGLRQGKPPFQVLVPFGIEVVGQTDDEEIVAAVRTVIAGHDALRTGFRIEAGTDTVTPFVVPAPDAELSVPVVAVPGLDHDARPQYAERQLAAMAALPMAFDSPPLIRASIHRFEPDHAVLLVAVEHQVFDGQSANVFRAELGAALQAPGRPLPRAVQFSEWVSRQHEYLAGPEAEHALDYGRTTLAGTTPYPDLKLPPAESPTETSYAEFVETLDPAYLAALRGVVGTESATPFIAFLAGIAAAWRQVSGATDAVVHCPCDNRSAPGAERILGWLAHSLILRVNTGGAVRWRDMIRLARNAAVSSYEYQSLPFPNVIRALAPEMHGTPTRQPRLYGSYTPTTDAVEKVPGGHIRALRTNEHGGFADVGLTFLGDERDGRLRLTTVFDPRSVSSGFARGVHEALCRSMRCMVEDLDAPIAF